MKKKIILFITISIISTTLASCGFKNNVNDNDSIQLDTNSATEENNIQPDTNNTTKDNNIQSDTNNSTENDNIQFDTNVTVNLYEGDYNDSELYLYREDMYGFFYYQVVISDVTDSTFDFHINYVDFVTQSKEEVCAKNTANFIENGNKAISYVNGSELYFEFPNGRNSLPDVVQISIKGLDIIDGIIFENNGISGKEFS